MGFFKRLWRGVKKAGRFAGKVVGKIGNVAGFLAPIAGMIHPAAGAAVSAVARGAQAIGKVANGVNHVINKGEEIAGKVKPVIDKVRAGARAVYNTGIPDKLTGGAVSRVVDKARRFGQKIDSRGNQMLDKTENVFSRMGNNMARMRDLSRKIASQVVVGGAKRPPPPAVPEPQRFLSSLAAQRGVQRAEPRVMGHPS